MSEENKALMRRIFDEIFNEQNHELARELYCGDCRAFDPAVEDDLVGHDKLIELLDGYRTALPGHKYEILDMVAENDKVVVRWKVDIPAAARWPKFSVEALSLCTIRHGQVHTVYQQWDNLGFLKAVGAVDQGMSVATALAAPVPKD